MEHFSKCTQQKQFKYSQSCNNIKIMNNVERKLSNPVSLLDKIFLTPFVLVASLDSKIL